MKLSELKNALKQISELKFILPDGSIVPEHFHVTEIGEINKNFIDCGGTLRIEKKISLQLWSADDIDHRLQASKLISIIKIAENQLNISDSEIEVEYQGTTIEKYQLQFIDGHFHLVSTQTDCLAREGCGIPEVAEKPAFQIIDTSSGGCTPGGGCC